MPVDGLRKRGRKPSGRHSPPGKKEKKDKKSPKAKWAKAHISEKEIAEQGLAESQGDMDHGNSSNENGEADAGGGSTLEQSSDNDQTFHGFSEEDLGDLGKIASLLKTLSTDMKEVKEGQGKILSELDVIRKDHKDLSDKLEKQSNDIKALQDYQSTSEKAISDIEGTVGNHERWLNSQETRLQVLDATVNDLVVESNVQGTGVITEYPYSRTIVAENVPYEDGENVEWKAKGIIHNFLQLRDINIVRVKRQGLNEERLGVVKIELPSKQSVDDVLRNKKKLRQHDDPNVNGIYLRQSQPDEIRQARRNTNILLKHCDPEGLFRMNARGDIVRQSYDNNRGGYSGRGRGRGGRSRGGPRGRGSGHARRHGFRNQIPADYSAWTPNGNSSQSTQNTSVQPGTGSQNGAHGPMVPPSNAAGTNPSASAMSNTSAGNAGNTQRPAQNVNPTQPGPGGTGHVAGQRAPPQVGAPPPPPPPPIATNSAIHTTPNGN